MNKDDFKNEEDLKNEDDLKYEEDLKNEDDHQKVYISMIHIHCIFDDYLVDYWHSVKMEKNSDLKRAWKELPQFSNIITHLYPCPD